MTARKSKIEWTQVVWNPTTGCDRVSPGCDNCYALTMAKRLKGMGATKYQRDGNPRTSGPGFGVSIHPGVLLKPLAWATPRRVFVNSMSDLFHDEVPDEFIAQVFAVMALSPSHTFQLLTKRHARMRSLLSGQFSDRSYFGWKIKDAMWELVGRSKAASQAWRAMTGDTGWWPLRNLHLGVSVEDQQRADIRIPALLKTPAAVRWLSMEPLLGPVDLRSIPYRGDANYLLDAVHGRYRPQGARWSDGWGTTPFSFGLHPMRRIDWVVLGGESGTGARPMNPDWARSLRDQCTTARVPFFFKQHGAHAPVTDKPRPRDLWVGIDGRTAPWQPDDGHVRRGGEEFRSGPLGRDSVLMRPLDKKASGRLLDGRTWDEYPEPVLAVTP